MYRVCQVMQWADKCHEEKNFKQEQKVLFGKDKKINRARCYSSTCVKSKGNIHI